MNQSAPEPPDNSTPVPASALRVWLWRLGMVAWVVVMGVALMALHHEWATFHLSDLKSALSRLGWWHVAFALVCTALSYLSNASIDLFSLRWLKKKLPVSKALGSSFIAAAFSLNAGGTLLGGGGVRLRLYTSLGLSAGEVAKMAGFAVVAGWAGHALVAGGLLMIAPVALPWLAPWLARSLGGLAVLTVLAGAGYGAWKGRDQENTSLPSMPLMLGALFASAFDWLMAGMAIRVLLPDDLGSIGTAGLLAAVILAQLLGAVSHVPGGIGVLELSITKLVGTAVSPALLAAALLSYRLLFYLVPFGIAAACMGAREMWAHRHRAVRGAGIVMAVWRRVGPRLGGLLALAGGFVLLLSANTPMEVARRDWLIDLVPLPLVEASHFLSSVAGMALIIVARGLQRRVQAAWWTAVFLSIAGVIFSILKGLDFEEAGILGFVLLCLLPFREHFYRHSAMWSRRFTAEWWLLMSALVLITVWLGFFTSRHVEYQSELWWQFSFEGDASRFLRGLVGGAVVLIGVLLAQWLRPGPARRNSDHPLRPEEWPKVTEIVAKEPQTQCHLALLGDKLFHFGKSGGSFLMYGEQGRSRIVMGDPVGNEDEWDDLLWSFNEAAEDEGFRVCYYQVSADVIPRFVDMGMRLFKLGEEARVSLSDFNIDTPAAKRLRQAKARAVRDGCSFTIWSSEEVSANIEALRPISDEWMSKHSATEKCFSLGRFDDAYLARGPVAVITKNGSVCAFANLWCSGQKRELSIDLMRHGGDSPGGVMDYLFTELFIWGKEEGYEWFSLGMAPLSGLAAHPLAPLWQKLGSLIYLRGGAFYNFQGLRDFKDKFHPEWEPRYLAVQGSWHLPAALMDITVLIGGGVRGVLGRHKKQNSSRSEPDGLSQPASS